MPRVVEVDIEELTAAGDGLAHAGRLRIAVPFTIPGERVRVRLDAGRNGHVFPRIPSPPFGERMLSSFDPPRDGCSAVVLRDVFRRLRPARAVLVFCSPEALATELLMIDRNGYRIRPLQPVDMFHHTAHIETVAIIDRLNPSN